MSIVMTKILPIHKSGKFYVDINGDIYRTNSKKLAKQSSTGRNKNYKTVSYTENGKQYICYVHRLVAETYIKNPYNKPKVNHIDGNKLNNHVENLEWVTQSENMKHAYKNGLAKSPMIGRFGKLNTRSKTVYKYSLHGDLVCIYDSVEIAARENGIFPTGIHLCANGKLKKSGGFVWKF